MPEKTFEYTVNYLQEVPGDTVFLQLTSLVQFQNIALRLFAAKHVFVVSPLAQEIAMSEQAARDIGLLS